jgi:uncharacterized protein (TIGR02996 family)
MDSDDPFLQTLLAEPDDETTRLVYADWLEERGDPQSVARSEFLRISHRLRQTKRRVSRRTELEGSLRKLSEIAGAEWADRLHPYRGARVRVRRGIFAGMEGIVDSCNLRYQTVTVILVIFGRPTSVKLEAYEVRVIS